MCEFLTHLFSIFPAVLLLLAYLQIHRSIPCLFLFFIFSTMMKQEFKILQIISIFIFGTRQWSLYFSRIIKNRSSLACYSPFFTFDVGYTEVESSLLLLLEGRLFWLIVRVMFTDFNINVPVVIYWKPYVMFIKFTSRKWSYEFLDVKLTEKKIG